MGPKAPQSSGSPSAHSFGLTRPSLLILAMKLLVLALSLASALGFGHFPEPDNTCISTCGMCYSSNTHEMTCHTEYAGNCDEEPSLMYWFAGADCNEEGAACYATYSDWGRLCIEGGTTAYGTEFTALDANCCPFEAQPSSAPTPSPTTWTWPPTPTAHGSCGGSCYDSTTYTIACGVPEDDCTGSWYEPGYISSWSGCCDCACGCDHASEWATDGCTYNDLSLIHI